VSGHTPGPWELVPESDDHEGSLFVVSEYEVKNGCASAHWIAECDLQEDEGQNRANARLIAAAPDLLEAATEMLTELRRLRDSSPAEWDELVDVGLCNAWDGIKAAIAKAEGK
jgi:hypothetical protein